MTTFETGLALGVGAIIACFALPSFASPLTPVPDSEIAVHQAFRPTTATITEAIKKVVIDQGSSGAATLPGDYLTVDKTTVFCNGSADCTVGFHLMAQVGVNSAAGNLWAVCGEVDGVLANPSCPYQGEAPTDGTYVMGNSLQVMTGIAPGKHILSEVVYTTDAALAGEYEANYTLYTP